MRKRVSFFLCALLAVSLWGVSSCEKMVVDEEQQSSASQEVKGNLILKVSLTGVAPMNATRADDAELKDYFTRLNFVAYQNGKKVKGVNQEVGADGFGEVGMQLQPGTYQVLVVAHSSDGNPTLSDPTKIDFTNKVGFSDTFYYYGDIEVKEEAAEHSITMTRVSSMIRFVINDSIPSDVTGFMFRYTGGSAAFNAVKGGEGNEASTQIVEVDYDSAQPAVFDLYTIVRKDIIDKGKNIDISLTVTAFRSGNSSVTKDIQNIKIEHNAITEVTGNFFTDVPGGGDNPGGGGDNPGGTTEDGDSISAQFNIGVNVAWGDTIRYTY